MSAIATKVGPGSRAGGARISYSHCGAYDLHTLQTGQASDASMPGVRQMHRILVLTWCREKLQTPYLQLPPVLAHFPPPGGQQCTWDVMQRLHDAWSTVRDLAGKGTGTAPLCMIAGTLHDDSSAVRSLHSSCGVPCNMSSFAVADKAGASFVRLERSQVRHTDLSAGSHLPCQLQVSQGSIEVFLYPGLQRAERQLPLERQMRAQP